MYLIFQFFNFKAQSWSTRSYTHTHIHIYTWIFVYIHSYIIKVPRIGGAKFSCTRQIQLYLLPKSHSLHVCLSVCVSVCVHAKRAKAPNALAVDLNVSAIFVHLSITNQFHTIAHLTYSAASAVATSTWTQLPKYFWWGQGRGRGRGRGLTNCVQRSAAGLHD